MLQFFFRKTLATSGLFNGEIRQSKRCFPVQKALRVPGVMDFLNCDCPSGFSRVSQFPSQRGLREGFFAFCRVHFFGSFLWAHKEMNSYDKKMKKTLYAYRVKTTLYPFSLLPFMGRGKPCGLSSISVFVNYQGETSFTLHFRS